MATKKVLKSLRQNSRSVHRAMASKGSSSSTGTPYKAFSCSAVASPVLRWTPKAVKALEAFEACTQALIRQPSYKRPASK